MADPRVVKLARAIVDFSAPVEENDQVAIYGGPAAEPLLRELYAACLQKGAHPTLFVDLPELEELFYRLAADHQLDYVSPIERLVTETFDCRIVVRTQVNSRALTAIPPEKQARRSAGRRDLAEIFHRRAAARELNWSVLQYPTSAAAQDAEMSLHDYAEFVYRACKVDEDDPVAAWKEQGRFQARLIGWLKGRSEVHILAPGTDLRLSVRDRVWINCDGENNFPDGEIFTGPVETSAEGHVTFSFPAVRDGREVEHVQLWFEGGRVVRAEATKNADYLHRMLEVDEGARRIGEFAFGTNYSIQRFTKNTLFDEKIGGTFHMALGSSYPESGGQNHSALHWDMVCDLRGGGEVRVDGDLFLRDGQFTV